MRTAPLLLAFLTTLSTSFAQISAPSSGSTGRAPSQAEIKDKYHVVQVDQFDVKPGIEFPPEYLKKLQQEISEQRVDAKAERHRKTSRRRLHAIGRDRLRCPHLAV